MVRAYEEGATRFLDREDNLSAGCDGERGADSSRMYIDIVVSTVFGSPGNIDGGRSGDALVARGILAQTYIVSIPCYAAILAPFTM